MSAASSDPFLPHVPDGWTINRFGRDIQISEGQVDPREEPWASTVLIAPNHIEGGTGHLLELETAAEQGADSGKYVAKKGQVLYSKIRPALNKVAIAPEDCLCSADMYAIEGRDGIDARYLSYYMRSRPFHAYASVTADRVKMPKINREELAAAPWARPPIAEQRAIAAFLDAHTSRIDTLVAKQAQLIVALRERRSAVISAQLLGHDLTRLRRLVTPERPMSYGILQCGEPVEDGVPYIGPSDMPGEGASPDLNSLRRTTREIAAAYARSALREGDVVVSIGPAYGKVAILDAELTGANLTQDTVRIAADPSLVDTRYLVWVLCSRETADYWNMEIDGATFRRLNLGTLARTPIPLPALVEQANIATYLDDQTAKIDLLISKVEAHIALANERRSALITAAVTGQVDVRMADRSFEGVV